MKIICLDDHPTMLDSLVRELNIIAPSSEVNAFQNTETALEFAEENGCDVLFCEICLYGDDGLLFAEKMQAINPRVNIIFTTVCEEAERAKEVFRLHPSGYVTKPYTREQIAAELNSLRYPVEEPGAPLRHSAPCASVLYRSPAASFALKSEPEPKVEPKHSFEPKSGFESKPVSAPTYTSSSLFSAGPASVPKQEPAAPLWVQPTAEPAKCDDASEPQTRPMDSKDLRRLSRAELLEMLIAQTKETDKLKAQLRETERKLENKTLTIENAGSIAQAAMQVNGVFDAAQRAADQYLENVRVQSQQFALREKEYTERAERILADAQARCVIMESETARKCEEMIRTAEAETQARWAELHEKMESYLRQHEQLRSLMGMYK